MHRARSLYDRLVDAHAFLSKLEAVLHSKQPLEQVRALRGLVEFLGTDCVGPSLGCFPPDSRLVVAGSVCSHLYQHLAATRWQSLNLSRLELLNTLPDEDLAAVKTLAHGFLLPILHGGGSNIKTAEALYSGAYVLGSEAAFRGFEDLLDLPEVLEVLELRVPLLEHREDT